MWSIWAQRLPGQAARLLMLLLPGATTTVGAGAVRSLEEQAEEAFEVAPHMPPEPHAKGRRKTDAFNDAAGAHNAARRNDYDGSGVMVRAESPTRAPTESNRLHVCGKSLCGHGRGRCCVPFEGACQDSILRTWLLLVRKCPEAKS